MSLALISRVPSVVLTVNWFVTSFPPASFTTAVPLIAFVSVATLVLFGSLVVRPLTVYLFPSTVNSSVSNPAAVFSLPS